MMKLEQVVAHWKAVLFQLVISGLFTDQFVYIYQTAVGIINQLEVASHSVKLWEIRELTEQPVITCIYLCGRIYASCLYYISNSPPAIEQKLNWSVK
jgi:hypothetical protein